MKRTLLLSTLVFMLAVQVSWAQVPETMSYQGVLRDAGGAIVADSDYSFTFSLYDVEEGGTPLWSETHESVAVTDGIFNVILGGTNPLTIPFDEQYWLGVTVGEDDEMTPRKPLTSVAYSLNARSVAGAAGWSLTGNPGTNPATNFLGTTDNQALELHVNGARALRIEPNADSPNVIGGHSGNSVTSGAYAAVIGGGGSNCVTDNYGTVDGGGNNQAGNANASLIDADYATVGGGYSNTASYDYATVGGGLGNLAGGSQSTVGGGIDNTASGHRATVGGGLENTASGVYATVGGGRFNNASGWAATVPGGYGNSAQGDYSFAAGQKARTYNPGSFVWSDCSGGAIACNVDNRWVARCSGGVYFYSDPSATIGVKLDAGDNAWSIASDRAIKEDLTPVDGRVILEQLAAMPVQEYKLKGQEPSITHIGPVAQDFSAAFGYGGSDTSIHTGDADGVALAAIRGLYELVQEKDAQIAALEERLAALETLVSSRAE